MIGTTSAASPGRGPVLAAKAIVLGGATFGAGLVASVVAFLVTQVSVRNAEPDPASPTSRWPTPPPSGPSSGPPWSSRWWRC